jgi:hypothetical protein
MLTHPNMGAELAASSVLYQPYIVSNFFGISDIHFLFHKFSMLVLQRSLLSHRRSPPLCIPRELLPVASHDLQSQFVVSPMLLTALNKLCGLLLYPKPAPI